MSQPTEGDQLAAAGVMVPPHFRDTLSKARDFLPEYANKQIIGALGTFYVDPSLIKHAQRHGLIMLSVMDGLMQILNEHGFVPKAY